LKPGGLTRRPNAKRDPATLPSTQVLERVQIPFGTAAFDRLMWWLFAGSVGARTRTLILFALRASPLNAQRLAEELNLDYTTVRHHIFLLEKNRVVVAEGEKYGRVYFVSGTMESHRTSLEAILEKTRLSRRMIDR